MLSSGYLLLGSALIGHALSIALPSVREASSSGSKKLVARDDNDWTPPGAPPMLPGQTLDEYLKNILSGIGAPTNPPPSKEKRDYYHNDYSSTTIWTEDDLRLNITLISGFCPHGPKPNTVAGNMIMLDGTDKENATLRDISDELYNIRLKYPDSEDDREVAIAQFSNTQFRTLYTENNALLDDPEGWICGNDTTAATTNSVSLSTPVIRHDELRRKLLEMNKLQYYTFILAVSSVGGAVVAGINAGITHAYANVELGAEAYFNTAVSVALSIFIATEASRFAPRIAGAESWSPLVLAVWGRRMVARSGAAMKKARTSTGRLVGSAAGTSAAALSNAASGSNQGGSTQNLAGCISPDQARAGAENLMEQGGGTGSGPLMSTALSLGYQFAGDSANVAAGENAVGSCSRGG